MNFTDLKTALSNRGFSYMDDPTLGRYINRGMHELEESDLWPFREASATGTAPLTITDLGTVELVLDSDQSSIALEPADWSELVGTYGDLSTDGTPAFYYIAWPSGVPTVATYPESTHTIGVQYYSVSPDLTGSDTPTIPARFHETIVDIAVREALRDKDNHASAEGLQGQIDRDLARMRMALFTDQVQGPGFIRIVAGSDDF